MNITVMNLINLPEKVDIDLYNELNSINNKKRYQYFTKLELLGAGAYSKVYLCLYKQNPHENRFVMKFGNGNFFFNEFKALLFLRDKMIHNEIPHYYNFMYSNFTNKNKKKYLILERCHENLFHDTLIEHPYWDLKEYILLFYQIADAVDYLEKMEMNHGDLWTENIMAYWKNRDFPNVHEESSTETEYSEEDYEETEKNDTYTDENSCLTDISSSLEGSGVSFQENYVLPEIRLIDFDASYKKGVCDKPNLGYSEDYRKEFYIGYDLSRLFDEILECWDKYQTERQREKKRRSYYIKQQQKKGKYKDVNPNESTSSLMEFDFGYIQYPEELIEWMRTLPITDPEFPEPQPDMSGERIKSQLIKLAKKNSIDLEKSD